MTLMKKMISITLVTKKLMMKKIVNNLVNLNKAKKKKKNQKVNPDSYAKGAGGEPKPKLLKAITDDSFTQKTKIIR